MSVDYPMAAGGFMALARIAIAEAEDAGLDPERVRQLTSEADRIRDMYLAP